MPRLSQEKREFIELNYQDKTIAQLSEALGCSASTISRHIKMVRDNDAAASSNETPGDTSAPDAEPATTQPSLDSYEYTPVDTSEHEVIELPRDTADGGMQRLLQSHTVADNQDDENLFNFNATSGTGNADANAEEGPETMAAQTQEPASAPIDSFEPDAAEVDALLEGLLGGQNAPMPGPPLDEPPAPSRRRKNTKVAIVPTSDSGKELPLVVLRTKCRLYLKQFPHVIEELAGTHAADQERFKKQIGKLPREELDGLISCIQSILVLESGCNMIKQTVTLTSSAMENVGPYVGARFEGLTSALLEQKEELDRVASMLVIDRYDWFAQTLDPSSQLAMLCMSTCLRVHNTNSLLDLQHQQAHTAAQTEVLVPDDLNEKYGTL